MPHSSESALDAIEAALSTQNQQFAAFVEAFGVLPPDTRLDISPTVLRAIEATATEATAVVGHLQTTLAPIGALRA